MPLQKIFFLCMLSILTSLPLSAENDEFEEGEIFTIPSCRSKSGRSSPKCKKDQEAHQLLQKLFAGLLPSRSLLSTIEESKSYKEYNQAIEIIKNSSMGGEYFRDMENKIRKYQNFSNLYRLYRKDHSACRNELVPLLEELEQVFKFKFPLDCPAKEPISTTIVARGIVFCIAIMVLYIHKKDVIKILT